MTSGPLSTTCTFTYTGGPQYWTVPAGISWTAFEVVGAAGGRGRSSTATGGRGASVTASIEVVPGQQFGLYVGGKAGSGTGEGGGNGGGNGASAAGANGGGGGGACDIRSGNYGVSTRILVAGGGGGVRHPVVPAEHAGHPRARW